MLAGRLIVPSALAAKSKKKDSEQQAAITPTGRSDAGARRTRSFAFDLRGWHAEIRIKLGFDPAIITGSAEIVRDFIGNSHEKSEEEAVVPRFRKVEKMVPLVDTLLAQHQAGRRVTQSILQFVPGSRKDGEGRRRLLISIQSFVTMYRRMPHERTPICFRC